LREEAGVAGYERTVFGGVRVNKAFVSIEALLALLLAGFALTILPALLSAHPNSALETVYEFQLAQDFAEVSVSNPQTLSAIKDFAKGDISAGAFLEEKFSRVLGEAGDYCLELKAREKVLHLNCRNDKMQKVSASRIIFDETGNSFFELDVSLGFYS